MKPLMPEQSSKRDASCQGNAPISRPPIHQKPTDSFSFERLEKLWEKYPQYHERTTFTTLEDLLAEHESYQKDFEELREEYVLGNYEKFLVQLSWSDLAYRHATMEKMQSLSGIPLSSSPSTSDYPGNPYVDAFMEQFTSLNTDHKACFLFSESYVSQFFVICEVCKKAEAFYPVKNLFPDEEKLHYLAIFDKADMDTVLLMFHLLYTNATEDLYGGYSLYDYSLPWYQHHLWEDEVVLRSPFLPDKLAKFQGNMPYYHNPSKTVYVRRNIRHILESGYFSSELDFFLSLTQVIMPFFQWWYTDLSLYEEKDGYRTDWRLERTKLRTQLTAEGIIKPKWKHELSLFQLVRRRYPDTLYQYRPTWLGRQSLDLFIPSLQVAIEYQGIQHYHPVEFFGGEEALTARVELDEQKKKLCSENKVRLLEWPYSLEPTEKNLKDMLKKEKEP